MEFGGKNNFYFCEGRFWKGDPIPQISEFTNAISSFFLSIFGLLCLFYPRKKKLNRVLQYLYILLILCGINSCLFHSSMSKGWKYMDELPMIIMISLGVSEHILAYAQYKKKNLTPVIKHGIQGVMMSYMLLVMVFDIVMEDPIYFRTFFGLPYVVVVYFLYYTYKNTEKYIKYVIRMSVISGLSGLCCWLLDYHFCNQWTVYLYFHSLWHILIGYSTTCLFEILHYYRIKNDNDITVKYILNLIPLIDGKIKKNSF